MEKLSSTRRGHLRSLANRIKPTVTIGKEGLNDKVLKAVESELDVRELVKAKVLKNCPITLDDVAAELSTQLECHIIQKVGHVIVFYREGEENPTAEYLV